MTEKRLHMRKMGMQASYLAACALHGTKPLCPDDLDMEELYRFCKFHSITAIVAMALEEIWKEKPAAEEIMKKWRQARDKAIRKNVLLNAERQRFFAYLESIGCWYMPLKGSLLQFDYPKFGMRQMSDNDILYDEEKTQQVHDYLLSEGYEAVTYLRGYHDEYVKQPVYNMEMHRCLFTNALFPVMTAYYENVKDRLIKDAGNNFGYHFSREDFYIFMVAHGYKHYSQGGVGIRTLMDDYVFQSKYAADLDWAYLERELRSIGAWEFAIECSKLGKKLFSDPAAEPALTPQEQNVLDIYFTSGAYGTEERAVENLLNFVSEEGKGFGKLRYMLARTFPNLDYLSDRYPVLRKYPWMAPIFYVRRFISTIFKRRREIGRELKNLKKVNK